MKMPYKIISEASDENWVQNTQTGRRMNKKLLSKRRAVRYLRALEANVSKNTSIKHGGSFTAKEQDHLQAIHDHAESLGADCGGVDDVMAKHLKHGDFSKGQKQDKIQAMHDHAQELGADCVEVGDSAKHYKHFDGLSNATQEIEDNPPDDIRSALYAAIGLCDLLESEDDEPDDLKKIGDLMRGLFAFAEGELAEGEAGEDEEEPEEAAKHKKTPVIEFSRKPESKSLDLSYIKALGINTETPEKFACKWVGRDTILHPVMIWGDKNKMDIEKDYFTRRTNFWDDVYGKSVRPLTWDHGQDDLFKESNPVIGKTVSWYDDDVARWAESVLNKDKVYRKFVDQWIDEKRIGASSDSMSQYVKRMESGNGHEITVWPWVATALTPIPAEPRMKEFSPEFLKSWNLMPDAPDMARREREAKLLATTLSLKKYGSIKK